MPSSLPGPVLALDTSGESASACLLLPGEAPRVLAAPLGTRAGEILHLLIRELLDDAGLAIGNLARVAAVRGPGSFTGLRVGLATASGLSLGAGIPAIGLETTSVAAAELGEEGDVAVVMDGGQGRLFAGWHRVVAGVPRALDAPLDLAPAELLARLASHPADHVVVRGEPSCLRELEGMGARRSERPLAGAAALLAASGDTGSGSLEALYARAPAIRSRTPA